MRQRTPTPAGTQRRLQALMARSWSIKAIAHETGLRAPKLARALENPATITPKLADGVIAAYDKLWDKTPPRDTPAQRELAEAAETVARQRSWAPPAAWDDEHIDDPMAKPAEGWRRRSRTQHRKAELAEDAQFVANTDGSSPTRTRDVAERLGVTTPALQKALSRQRAQAISAPADRAQAVGTPATRAAAVRAPVRGTRDLPRESTPSRSLARTGAPGARDAQPKARQRARELRPEAREREAEPG